jgi:hypothetical protein
MDSLTSLHNVLLIKVISPALRDIPKLGTGEIEAVVLRSSWWLF